ncbi:MAG: hypothetical protein Ta2A_18250 [Treponemataceae bacterium]|nr:MAG: hypothetical protein Ta2A_18250 [Treponemataceae bacterium]
MSKLHVVGIGGTGHKLVTAVIHLASCGAFKGSLGSNQIDSIRVMTIDADNSNGNLTQAKSTLSAYRSFYDALSANTKLDLIEIESVTPETNISLYKDGKESISKAFKIPQYSGSDDDKFIRFLYANDEIDAEFEQGFYGHTSIGTLVVKDILGQDEAWKKFLTEINANDFVVIAGSIFGGTGASAIPVALDELKARQRDTDFKLAAVIMTPYFKTVGKITEAGELQPDANNFQTKAKAALYYYNVQEQYKKTDALYVIGEPEVNFSNEIASRGSSKQTNKAHPVELFAATAVIDFIKENKDRKGSGIIAAKRDSGGSGEYYYTWNMLQDVDSGLPKKIVRLMKMAVFYNKVLYEQMKNGTASGTWVSKYDPEICTEKDSNQNLVYENVRVFLVQFVKWFYDIHKKNLAEIDQATNALKFIPDARVKLFNVGYETLFDNRALNGNAEIDKFTELVYNDQNPKLSAKIYSDICSKPPENVGGRKGFPALFAMLDELFDKPLGVFGKKPKTTDDKFKSEVYLSKDNNAAFIIGLQDGKLWAKGAGADLLLNIADGLPNVQNESLKAGDLAIPSPWSIFILNELTLTEKKFATLNKTTYNQWCGLIALLVLRDLNLYTKHGLLLQELKIGAVGDGDFFRVVEDTLKPNSYIFDNPNWTNAYCLSLNGETIAFLAHNTIVCPTYSYSAAIRTSLHTMAPTIIDESGKFLSPDNYFSDQSQAVNRNAKYALKLFLDKLKAEITKQAAHNQKGVIKSLQDLTDLYIADLGKTTANPDISISDVSVNNVYDLFEKVRITSSHKAELPFVLADARANVAIIGLNICGISAASPQASTIFVTENLLYNQISAEYIQKHSGATVDGITLIYEKDLLGESMLMVNKGGSGVFKSLQPKMLSKGLTGDYEIIWPVNEKLLDWFSMDQLNKMLSVSIDNGIVRVTLEVKLAGDLGNHSVQKEYKVKNVTDSDQNSKDNAGTCYIYDKNLLPFWAVWPYTEILQNGVNTWHRYNFFCVEPNYRGISVLEIEPLFLEQNKLLGEQKLSTISTVINDVYYRRYKELPVALKLKQKTSEKTSQYMGAVFLEEPARVQRGDITWNIGLDFGTTTTTAFYTTSGATPKFLQLITEYNWAVGSKEPKKDEIKSALTVLSHSGDNRAKELYFIDEQCLKQKGYTTAYEKMDTTRNTTEPTIFDTGRIFWHNFENFKVLNTAEGRRDRLLTNIKWENEKSNAGKYLNQLLTQMVYSAAEKGVRKINWFFSYPTAFSEGAKIEFSDMLDSLIKQLQDDTGVEIAFTHEHLITESIAAAFYFRNKNPKQSTFLCVDIGGSSSDISIWIKEQHIFQTSIRFASRDMFIAPLKHLLERKNVMDIVRGSETDNIATMLSYGGKNDSDKYSDEKIQYFIETVLFEYYDSFKNRLESLGGDDKKAYQEFRHSVFIAYSGLVYYLANIIAALLKSKKIDNDITQIVFGLSGKGSKLTDWIKAYCPKIYKEAQSFIEEKTKIEIEFRDQFDAASAKTETATGMICDLDGAGNQNSKVTLADPEIFIGCKINAAQGKAKEKEYPKNSFINPYDDVFRKPQTLKVSIDKELVEFGEFIDFYNTIAAKTKNDMPVIPMDWYKNEKKTLWNQIKTETERVLEKEDRFDPPFIVMLKVFLELFGESGK